MQERRSTRDLAFVIVRIDESLRGWVQSRLDLTGETPGDYVNRLIYEELLQFSVPDWEAGRRARGSRGPRRRAGICAVVLGLALGIVAAMSVGGCETRDNPPRLEVQRTELGVFPPGETKVQMDVINAGDEPLVIEKILSSCGSVRVAEFPVELKAQATGTVELELDVVPGSWRADLLVVSNDKRDPHRLRLAYRGARP